MRGTVHKCTTKVERHHRFAKHLAFGSEVIARSNDPLDQEKSLVYNELVANAVVVQNVVDQTEVLHLLKSKGVEFEIADLAHMSPYWTHNLKLYGDFPNGSEARSDAEPLRAAELMIDSVPARPPHERRVTSAVTWGRGRGVLRCPKTAAKIRYGSFLHESY